MFSFKRRHCSTCAAVVFNLARRIHRIHNCAAQNIIYERVDNIEIDAALQLLYSHKSEIEEQGANVIAVNIAVELNTLAVLN